MSDPQGLISFPGIQYILGGSFALTHGTEPSVAVIRSDPQDQPYTKLGQLRLTYGGNEIVNLKDCIVTAQRATVSPTGRTVISTTIHDRRWKWQFGSVSGIYNKRNIDGEVDDTEDNKKTVKELIELLLDSLNETGYEVADGPAESYPEAFWDYASPADELSAILKKNNLILHLGLDDKVRVFARGSGDPLPNTGLEQNDGRGVSPTIRPSKIQVVAGHTRFQSIFKLTPVGLDSDGKIKLLKDLSYRPGTLPPPLPGQPESTGFERQGPNYMFGVTGTFTEDGKTIKKRDLALRSVWRWFKIEELAEGGFQPMGEELNDLDIEVTEIGQFEFEGGVLDTVEIENEAGEKVKRQKPPQISGKWHTQSNPPVNVKFGAIYSGDFDIDQELRLVKFKDPVYQTLVTHSASSASQTIKPPELFLKVAYKLKNKGGQYVRATFERDVTNPDSETKPLIVRHDEIHETYKQKYKGAQEYEADGVDRNHDDVKEDAEKFIDVAEEGLNQDWSQDVTYYGLVPVLPSGSILQVEWACGDESPATTRAGRNIEVSPTYPNERVRNERSEARRQSAKGAAAAAEQLFQNAVKARTRP